MAEAGELEPSRTGKRPAHAPYSSAALAVNAFGRWLGAEEYLRVAGLLGGFSEPLQIESRQQIAHGGGEANLDCLLRGPGLVVGVESKLTETLAPHSPTPWKKPYGAPALAEKLCGGWREVFAASRGGTWQPAHLGVEQLIKHALALVSQFPNEELHLVYVWWEPENASEIPELVAHRAEVDELQERIGPTSPQFHALTYGELFDEWERLSGPGWRVGHLTELRARYVLEV